MIHAFAMRGGSQPVVFGLAVKPKPGIDGITTSKACVRRSAMRGGIGERVDDLELLDHRAGPAMRDDHGERVLVLRLHVDEVDVEAVDLGEEVGKGVQPRLAFAPVVFVGPVVARASA